MKLNKILMLLFIVFSVNIFAKDIKCGLSYNLMELIAKLEGTPKRQLGYPFIISFNNDIDYGKILTNHKYKRIDNRTIDCKDRTNCVKILTSLEKVNVTNVDLGAFQTHYQSHKYAKGDYFSLERSYENACNFLETLIKKHGYSWETIARYHSSTPQYNLKYRKRIAAILIASNK